MLSAILLAAGSSRRMGPSNKLLLPWQGKTILSATAENLLTAGIGEVIVVTGHQSTETAAAVSTLPVRIIRNPHHERGMTGSIQTGIGVARGDGYMICLADMVAITPQEYALLATAFEQQYRKDPHCIILPEFEGQKGNPVIFSSQYRDALLRHPEKEGCKSLVRSHPDHHLYIPMTTNHILADIDFPEDYQAMLE